MANDPLYGWDLTLKTVQRDIRRKSDILIAFIHWTLTKRGYRSIGIGDERTLTGDEESSELLPTAWNDSDNYTIRYVLESKLYILHGLVTDDNLIVNLMRSEDLAVSNIAFNVEESVKDTSGPLSKMLPHYKDIIYNVKRDLVDTVSERPTSSSETQTHSRNEQNRRVEDPLRVDPLRVTPRPCRPDSPTRPDLGSFPEANPYNIGGADLNPFGAGGGGMIFNPFAPRRDIENPGLGIPGGLPRNAVPPGARFDPFGPVPPPGGPREGRRPPPDADHLPPPGNFNDYMFM